MYWSPITIPIFGVCSGAESDARYRLYYLLTILHKKTNNPT